MKKLYLTVVFSFVTIFATAKVCGCGSMAGGQTTMFATQGDEDCCEGQVDNEFQSAILFWEPTDKEGVYQIVGQQQISNSLAQSYCCDDV